MVLNEVEKGGIRGGEAAELMGVSLRQERRLMVAYREEGAAGLAHGNRGRRPPNAIDEDLKKQVVGLARGRYDGCNQQHYTELLKEREGIKLSRSSVRRILLADGVKSPRKRRPPQHRRRRERYPQEGMLLQIDGSPHDWFEGRGAAISLLGAIDDATGKVPYALFREQEDSPGYFRLLQGVTERYGIPLALYHDRHSIFEVSPDEKETIAEQLAGKTKLTQFGRLMRDLAITSISALSPQAKGRIERLWETFQDRLVSEMRLAGVSTLEEGNCFLETFLPRYNARFAVPPTQPGTAYRKTSGLDLEAVFCFKHERVVGMDNVVRFQGQRLQVLPSPLRLSYARCHVQVHQQLDGTLKVYYQGGYLDTCRAPAEASRRRELVATTDDNVERSHHPVTKPAQDHPWRQWVYR